MKNLPYFRWYPADAETDESFRAMDDADVGFYVRCLNHAWINGGIPADAGERARVLRTRRDTADKRWVRVGKCFATSELDCAILVNPRQEVERKLASHISEVRAESAKARSKSNAIAPIRAYDSVYVSSSVLEISKKKQEPQRAQEPARFAELWALWPRQVGKDSACRDYISVVSTETEDLVFACAKRYLDSDEVRRGAVKGLGSTTKSTGWLIDCARDQWGCKWPSTKKFNVHECLREIEAEEDAQRESNKYAD